MFEVDWRTKTILEAGVETGQQRVLGRTDAAGLLAPGIEAGKVYVNMNATTGTTEMATRQELLHQAEWLVTAEGEIDGNHYAHVLKPHGTVTVKGVGEAHCGIYYVTHVTHTFSPRGYTQFFRAKRNALMPSGVEDFAGPTPGVNRFL
jgi:hypothetical protein